MTAIASKARYDQKFFDANGNLVFEDIGTIHSTRLSVDQFADQADAAPANNILQREPLRLSRRAGEALASIGVPLIAVS